MNSRLRYYQDSILFFLIVLLFGMSAFQLVTESSSPSHPLSVEQNSGLVPQKDGGLFGISR